MFNRLCSRAALTAVGRAMQTCSITSRRATQSRQAWCWWCAPCHACADPAAACSYPALAEWGRRAQGDCPAGLHARCSTCQVSLAGPSQCLACFSPFVLHHENNFCGCALGSTLARDPASQQETWCALPSAAQRC